VNRRHFLGLFGLGVAGIALDQAIPFNRVWSFPKEIKIAFFPPVMFGGGEPEYLVLELEQFAHAIPEVMQSDKRLYDFLYDDHAIKIYTRIKPWPSAAQPER
jgi:hypothetical protein